MLAELFTWKTICEITQKVSSDMLNYAKQHNKCDVVAAKPFVNL